MLIIFIFKPCRAGVSCPFLLCYPGQLTQAETSFVFLDLLNGYQILVSARGEINRIKII